MRGPRKAVRRLGGAWALSITGRLAGFVVTVALALSSLSGEARSSVILAISAVALTSNVATATAEAVTTTGQSGRTVPRSVWYIGSVVLAAIHYSLSHDAWLATTAGLAIAQQAAIAEDRATRLFRGELSRVYLIRRFAFQRGVTVASRCQFGRPA